jgi:hypothetical protein
VFFFVGFIRHTKPDGQGITPRSQIYVAGAPLFQPSQAAERPGEARRTCSARIIAMICWAFSRT